ncbi:phage repressor protein CI [Rahnella variigena]|uniref:phage repressor protein CI n=1 Tax=Rahnella variigena TaxID=574964 RepID=UPI003CF51A9C
MRLENAVAADVLERILSAYGFTMQKELSDKLGIAKSNVASWLQRGQIPGNVLVQCVLDTGVDVKWLVEGGFANANENANSNSNANSNATSERALTQKRQTILSGSGLIKKMLSSGGKPVLQRIMKSYNFSTQKELSDYLGISTGTISTWIRREYFPGDVVITCALDTNSSLAWLATGFDFINTHPELANISSNGIKRIRLVSGIVENSEVWFGDISLFNYKFSKALVISTASGAYFAEEEFDSLCNGCWLLSIEGMHDIYTVNLLPKSQVNVKNSISSFICDANDILPIAKIIFSTKKTC